MSKALPTDTAVGSTVSFVTGPTAVRVDNAEVTGHDGQFIVTKDATGKVRKIRPGALRG